LDPLRRHDIVQARALDPAVKLAQALELMQEGIRRKRDALRLAHPDESDAEIEARLERWLCDEPNDAG
jgi:hypothetical protein